MISLKYFKAFQRRPASDKGHRTAPTTYTDLPHRRLCAALLHPSLFWNLLLLTFPGFNIWGFVVRRCGQSLKSDGLWLCNVCRVPLQSWHFPASFSLSPVTHEVLWWVMNEHQRPASHSFIFSFTWQLDSLHLTAREFRTTGHKSFVEQAEGEPDVAGTLKVKPVSFLCGVCMFSLMAVWVSSGCPDFHPQSEDMQSG